MLKAQPAARDVRTAQGSTPLHLAATNPDLSALKALLAAGADPNARDGDGATPLHMAAYTQNARHAQLLLEAGSRSVRQDQCRPRSDLDGAQGDGQRGGRRHLAVDTQGLPGRQALLRTGGAAGDEHRADRHRHHLRG